VAGAAGHHQAHARVLSMRGGAGGLAFVARARCSRSTRRAMAVAGLARPRTGGMARMTVPRARAARQPAPPVGYSGALGITIQSTT
jgi:hypothetical protein